MKSIAIVGGGMSGFTVANILKKHLDITIFEKSRGVGGRMSTRRADPYFFDHGAQFFRAQTNEFQAFVSTLIQAGVVQPWYGRFVEIENRKIIQKREWEKDTSRYVGVPGMSAVVKHLNQGLRVNMAIQVASIFRQHEKWSLKDDAGNNLGDYDWVVLAVPAEQASVLLPSCSLFAPQIGAIKMQGAFSLMLGFQNALSLDFDVACLRGENISSIFLNSSKPGRSVHPPCLVIQSTSQWANDRMDQDQQRVADDLFDSASAIIGYNLRSADYTSLHRWRYATIEKQTGDTHFIDKEARFGLCGDWFIESCVEATFTSGFKLASEILKGLNEGKKNA